MGLSGAGLGRLGHALEPLNCVLGASWEGLEGFWRHLEAIWVHLGGFGGRLAGAKAAPSLVWGGYGPFLRGFLVFFQGLKPKSRISENVDFP